MKTVCIVGAGPAGLVAAKTLLKHSPGAWDVTVLEKNDHVGGMWPVRKDDHRGLCHPEMRTNLSRFTVSFSDLAWESVDIEQKQPSLPAFPQAWQVGRYLYTYAKKYLPKGVINLGCKVTKAEQVTHRGKEQWKVEWTGPKSEYFKEAELDLEGPAQLLKDASFNQGYFDHLIVASGFFHNAKEAPFRLPTSWSAEGSGTKITHSSRFRDLQAALPRDDKAKNIVVVGGSMSGAEAAANAAFQISQSLHSPDVGRRLEKYKVYHITTKPFYSMPAFLPTEPVAPPEADEPSNPAPTFAPIDLNFYNLSRRPGGPKLPMSGQMSAPVCQAVHKYLRSLIGTDQKEIGAPAIVTEPRLLEKPAYVTISDAYSEFVRAGDVVAIRGRATELTVSQSGETASLRYTPLDGSSKEPLIPDVALVVHASGFTPHRAVSWLSEPVRETMECDSLCHRLPLLLQKHCICHEALPTLGFVGFYEGPFWGVMEMQARMIARKWSDDEHVREDNHPESQTGTAPNGANRAAANGADAFGDMRKLRDALMQSLDDVPQFWMGDYVGLIEGFAVDMEIERNDTGFNGRDGPILPARYTVPEDDQQQADITLSDLHKTLAAVSDSARYVARAAFRAMQGKWKLYRTMKSEIQGFLQGKFEGKAWFYPRLPTDPAYDAEYLYREEVEITAPNGQRFHATRHYVYRYSNATDKITVWFVKQDNLTVDYFFYDMRFQPRDQRSDDARRGWVAHGEHFCEPDNYKPVCEFRFRGVNLRDFGIQYEVKGPKKDYTSETWYER